MFIPPVALVNKYFCWILVLFPVIVMYSFFNIPLPYLAILLGLTVAVISKKHLFVRNSYWVTVFLCYMAIVPSIFHCITTHSLFGLVQAGTWLFLIYIILFNEYVEKEYLELTYQWVLIVAILFFLFQELFFLVSGSRISGIIPFLDFTYYDDSSTELFSEVQQKANRSSSFFLEPAMFVQFLIPGLAINMKYTRKNFICYIGLLIIIIISRTGTGLVIGAVSSLIYMLNWKNGSKVFKVTFYAIMLIVGLISIRHIMASDYYAYISYRTEEFSSDESSAFERFFRGYLLLNVMSPLEKLAGVGTKNLLSVTQRPGVSAFFRDDDIYMNGVQAVLVGGGIVGLGLFFLMLWKIYRRADSTGKYIIILFIVQSFMAASYLSSLMLLNLIFALKYNQICLSKSISTKRISMTQPRSIYP